MRRLMRFLLLRPILWLIARFSSAPNRERIVDALSTLRKRMENDPGKKGFVIPFDCNTGKFIIFSDQHKGRKNGADDFMMAEKNYLEALDYYNKNGFHLICLGDCEELWENMLLQVKKHNQAAFEAERKFALRNAFTKIFGNHDLDWEINPTATADLRNIYTVPIAVLEGVILQTTVRGKMLQIFCTHGHQGDEQSDGNWFSKFFVSKIWAPFQAYLRINPNTPAYDKQLKSEHNSIMYEWSAQQKNLLLITGHTHQPVFESLTHLERLHRSRAQALATKNMSLVKTLEEQMEWRKLEDHHVSDDFLSMKPTYFNSGCCCFDDGDITGIEINNGCIRLIKWEEQENTSVRVILEETPLHEIATAIE